MKKITEEYDKMDKINVGNMTIGSGISRGKIWIENDIGEGGDFPVKDVEELLRVYFNKKF